MIRSMTGYGRAEAASGTFAVTVEARSLNHRHLDITLKLPRAFAGLELDARRLIQDHVRRGRVDVSASLKPLGGQGAVLTLDAALARQYAEEARALGEMLGIPARPTVEWLLERPGVAGPGEPEPVPEEAGWPALAEALTGAMEALVARREAEGRALAKELVALHVALRLEVERMGERAPAARVERSARIRERIQALLGEVPLDEARLAVEVAVWADRADVGEELARLRAHLGQLAELLDADEPVGRALDFLVQEMHREVNTIASKANDLELSRLALAAKGLLEKIREQIQNVE